MIIDRSQYSDRQLAMGIILHYLLLFLLSFFILCFLGMRKRMTSSVLVGGIATSIWTAEWKSTASPSLVKSIDRKILYSFHFLSITKFSLQEILGFVTSVIIAVAKSWPSRICNIWTIARCLTKSARAWKRGVKEEKRPRRNAGKTGSPTRGRGSPTALMVNKWGLLSIWLFYILIVGRLISHNSLLDMIQPTDNQF